MRWSGVLLVVAGIWVTAQITVGDALGRLGISGSSTSTGSIPGSGVGPDPLPPVPDQGYSTVPHDAHGHPL